MVNASFECENRPLFKLLQFKERGEVAALRACVLKLELDANYAKEG